MAGLGDRARIGAAVDGLLERLGIGGLGRPPHPRAVGRPAAARLPGPGADRASRRLLLLDEPTSGVDLKTRDDILHLLADLNGDGITIVLTTHELNTVAAHLPWVVCVNGAIVAEGDPGRRSSRPAILGRTYGADLRVVRQDGLVLVADAAPHRLRDALRHRHERLRARPPRARRRTTTSDATDATPRPSRPTTITCR